MLNYLQKRLGEGSTILGVLGLASTALISTVTTVGTNHPLVAVITGIASFIAVVFPESKGAISTTESLLVQLEPIVVDAWPYIEQAIEQYKANQQSFVPTASGRV
jgi:hypothetical protein